MEMPDALTPFFAPFCHQVPGRCLTFGGEPFPLCARCAGLYAGIAVSAAWLATSWLARRRPWLPRTWAVVALVAPLVCLADGLSGASHWLALGNAARFLIGHAAGAGIVLLAGLWLRPAFPAGKEDSVHGPPYRLLALLLLGAVPLLLPLPAVGRTLAWADVAGWLAMWAIIVALFMVASARLGRLVGWWRCVGASC